MGNYAHETPGKNSGGGQYYSHTPGGTGGGVPDDPRYTHHSGPANPNAGLQGTDGADGYYQDNGDGTYTAPDGTVLRMVSTSNTGVTARGQVEDKLNDQQQSLDAKIQKEGIFTALINGDLVKSLAGKATSWQTEQQQYQHSMQRQAKTLAKGLQLRPNPNVPSTDYRNTSHPQLKHMVETNNDTATVGQNGADGIKIGNELTGHQQTMAQAIAKSESGWQGSAGDSARDYMAKLTNWVGKAGQGIQLTGTQLSQQSEAGYLAKNSMPEPVDFNVAAANQQLQQTTNPIAHAMQYSQDMAKYQAQQEAQQKAAHVVQTYDNSLGGSSTTPAFATPPTFGDGGGGRAHIVVPPDHGKGHNTRPPDIGGGNNNQRHNVGGNPDGNSSYNPHIPGGNSSNPSINTPTGNSGGDNSGGQYGPVNPGGRVGIGNTNPSGTGPGDFGSNGPSSGPGFGPGQGGPGGGRRSGGGEFGGMPIGGMGGGFGGGEDSVRSGKGFGSGSGGFGSGSGSGGSASGSGGTGSGPTGAGGAGRAGASGASSAEAGAGGRSGAGAAAAEESAMQRGAAGARGAGGRGMGMMPRGGGSKGGEDGEHQTASYLVEADPDSIFGTDEKTAPPVIGA